MATKEEEEKRLKLKLWLYGSYTREKEMLENRYLEIVNEQKYNDMPLKAAINLGYRNDDPKNPAVDQMKIDEASILNEAGSKEEEISYLGLDDYLENLSEIERLIIDEIYVRNNTYRGIAKVVNMSKSSVHRLANEIIKKGTGPT